MPGGERHESLGVWYGARATEGDVSPLHNNVRFDRPGALGETGRRVRSGASSGGDRTRLFVVDLRGESGLDGVGSDRQRIRSLRRLVDLPQKEGVRIGVCRGKQI